jgi:hypothetical protein
MDFPTVFEEVRSDFGLLAGRPGGAAGAGSLLSVWDDFAAVCEARFDGHLDEYRRLVECFDFTEHLHVDRSGIPDGSAWYWTYFPSRRGPRFAADLLAHYGGRGGR